MNVTVTETATSTNIVVDGNIDVLNFKNFQKKLASVSRNTSKDIVIDLINMDYISSTTIGDLYNLRKAQEKKGKKLIFNNISFAIVKSLNYCLLLQRR